MSTHLSIPAITLLDFLTCERTVNAVPATSKKKALELIAKTLSTNIPELNENTLFEHLVQREKLGSTAIGHGCALPHCRANTEQVFGCFLKLAAPIDFDAPDKEPVDLIFSIVVPTEATDMHLNILAYIADLFHNDTFRSRLRSAKSNEELYQILRHLA
ncbi:PTS IIA-like nitrogen regulatory protein PtsN [Candidatus Berkiella cookevillensis]|uniref:Nitrogen regulatory protein n=1 Tax=Candidatus Berkiella cookevillensis TaxID=437022 RepID=A0A0Q9YKK1_9GAMM|nr:PTS IIA-like nitrogen regulatory protein PtsN [Candidatus Berkiella cookevillensis]MCS5709239.1 PTS IIA-like nitrogen regulatory protein PtsN [Candidatus Berkiella cookevillensis]